jgi:hypothetical protein
MTIKSCIVEIHRGVRAIPLGRLLGSDLKTTPDLDRKQLSE